VILAVAEMASC